MVKHGFNTQDAAIDHCKKLNAVLPLPKSKGEAFEFLKVTGGEFIWMGMTDYTLSGNKAAWKDLRGNLIGSSYVNLRVKELI